MIKKQAPTATKGGPSGSAKSSGKPQLKQPPVADTGEDTPGGEGDEGADSEADVFDNVRPQGTVDNGKYEAVIKEFVLQDADEKGRSVRLKVAIADEGEFQGVELAQFYKVLEAPNAAGKVTAGKGAAFLKADLVKLGHENVRFADMPDVFEEIVEAKTGVLVTVKQNGAFTNVYINGLSEDSQVIADFLATNPF